MRSIPSLLRKTLGLGSVRRMLVEELRAEFLERCRVGERFRVGDGARCHNHSGDPERIEIGDGVVIDGIIECYKRGHLTIGDYSFVGRSRVYCATRVSIGVGVLISDNVCLMDSDLHSYDPRKRLQEAVAWADGHFPDVYTGIPNASVVLDDHVWVGFGACILKGVTLGTGCVVGAGAVVTRDVPPWTVVGGNPARVIRELTAEERAS